LAITNYDCGDISDVVISSNNYNGLIQVTSDGGNGKILMSSGMEPVSFLCSGQMSIRAPLNSIHVFLSSVSLQGVWSENFLMGLAGVVCGSLLAYVCVKYAV
jgi:hypothetical protein